MITRIDISNVRSIGTASVLFEKAKYKYLETYTLNSEVANPIAVYGKNGSGKSSFVNAIYELLDLLISDKDRLSPFVFNMSRLENQKKPSSVRIHFKLSSDSFVYSLSTTIQGIAEESLHFNSEMIMIRKGTSLTYGTSKTRITAPLFPALRFLASDSIDENSPINRAFSFLSNIALVNANTHSYLAKSFQNKSSYDMIVEKSNQIRSILKEYNSFPEYEVVSTIDKNNNKQYFMKMYSGSHSFVLPFSFASQGMQDQSFILAILLSLPKNGVLLIDEIETALHPLTIMNFIDLVVKNNIQLVFTSHNTYVLSSLRPDNVLFAYWENGFSTYRRLSDIYPNIREVNNIEKMYLSSTFDEAIEGN